MFCQAQTIYMQNRDCHAGYADSWFQLDQLFGCQLLFLVNNGYVWTSVID